MNFKYSYNTIVYTGEDYSIQASRVANYGYDAIKHLKTIESNLS